MKALLAFLTLAVAACQASSPLDAFPQLDLDESLVGTWRCIPLDADETDEAWVTVRANSAQERTYAITWREGSQTQEYEAFASSVADSTILNVREAGDADGWAFVRYDFLAGNLLRIERAREEIFDGTASSSEVRAALERALDGDDSAFEDFMVCVGARGAQPDA